MNVFQDNRNCFQPYFMNQTQCQCQEKNPKLFDSQEAFMLGNLFKELYMTYQGFSNYCLQPQSPKQQALLEVQMYRFVAHELNLYLDMHPQNQRMVQLFHEYTQKADEAQKNYEKKFGPLSVNESENQVPFQWVEGPWPWEHQC